MRIMMFFMEMKFLAFVPIEFIEFIVIAGFSVVRCIRAKVIEGRWA